MSPVDKNVIKFLRGTLSSNRFVLDASKNEMMKCTLDFGLYECKIGTYHPVEGPGSYTKFEASRTIGSTPVIEFSDGTSTVERGTDTWFEPSKHAPVIGCEKMGHDKIACKKIPKSRSK